MHYCPFFRWIHQWPVGFPCKGQRCGKGSHAMMSSLYYGKVGLGDNFSSSLVVAVASSAQIMWKSHPHNFSISVMWEKGCHLNNISISVMSEISFPFLWVPKTVHIALLSLLYSAVMWHHTVLQHSIGWSVFAKNIPSWLRTLYIISHLHGTAPMGPCCGILQSTKVRNCW